MKRLLLLFLLLPLWYASTAQEWLPLKARAEADTTLKSSPAVCLVDRTNVQIAETGSEPSTSTAPYSSATRKAHSQTAS